MIKVDDSVADFQQLLLALYDRVSFDTGDIDGFLHLSSLLRMATKYLIDWLRKLAIDHLCQSWPVTIQAWESMNRDVWRPHPVLLINLALQVDAHIFLPVAFCLLGKLPMDEMMDVQLPSAAGPKDESAPHSLFYIYRHIDYHRMRDDLVRSLYKILAEIIGNSTGCVGVWKSFLKASAVENGSPLDILNAITGEINSTQFPKARRHNARLHVLGLKKTWWESLPGWFALESWDRLRGTESSSQVDHWPEEMAQLDEFGDLSLCDTD